MNENLTMIETVAEFVSRNQPKFKLGDQVMSKFTGLPNIGIIVDIKIAPYHWLLTKYNFSRWDNLFENWRKKYIYTLAFNEKVIPINFEEYTIFKKEGHDLASYEDYPKYQFIEYPEDDLELFE